MLLRKETHLVPKEFEYVLRLADRPPILPGVIANSLAEFQACHNLGGLGFANAVELDQFTEGGSGQSP